MSEKQATRDRKTQKKEVQLENTKQTSSGPIQVHFGNVEVLKLKLLEANNKNLTEILNLQREILAILKSAKE